LNTFLHKIIIIDSYQKNGNNEVQHVIKSQDTKYELRVVLFSQINPRCNWNGEVYSRHVSQYKIWWAQGRCDSLPRQMLQLLRIQHAQNYTLVYVRIESTDILAIGLEFLTYIGGQNHILCHEHQLPLIASTGQKKKCNCERKEHYSCSNTSCNCCICKRCAQQHDNDIITYIKPATSDNDDDDSVNDNDSISSTDNNESINMGEYVENNNDTNDFIYKNECTLNDMLERNNFNDFVTTSYDPDITEGCADDDNREFGDLPSTNAGKISLEIRDETPRSGIQVSGHVLLNQCGSLLTRKNHDISIALLYPEAIFSSIF
jgi:hypothetical protein